MLFRRHVIYKMLMIMVTLLMTIEYLRLAFSPYVRYFLVWGAVILIWDFLTYKDLWRTKLLIPLMLFMFCYLITILVNGRAFFVKNMKAYLYMFLVFFFVYADGICEDREQAGKERRILGTVLLGMLLVLSTLCFLTFLFNFSYTYLYAQYCIGYLGMVGGRLAGLFNSNTGGFLYVLAILGFLYSLVSGEAKKKLWRGVCIYGVAVNYCCLILSYSRTSIAAFSLSVTVVLLYVLREKVTGSMLRVGIGILAFGGILLLTPIVRSGLMIIPGWFDVDINAKYQMYRGIYLADGSGTVIPTALASEGVLTRLVNAALSGRLDLWIDGVKIFLEHPLLGISREALFDGILQVSGKEDTVTLRYAVEGGGIHNMYLSLLACSGLLGTLPLLGFAGANINGLIRSRKKWIRKPTDLFVFECLIVGSILIMEIFEERTMFRFNFFNMIFWMILGDLTGEWYREYSK